MDDNGPNMVEGVLSAVRNEEATVTDIVIVDNQLSAVCMTNYGENAIAV